MWATQEQRFEIPLDRLQDNVTWIRQGVSFIDNANNGLQDKREWMIKRALTDVRGRKMRKQGEWSRLEVQKYYSIIPVLDASRFSADPTPTPHTLLRRGPSQLPAPIW
jgi:hypothetical protein